MKKQSLKIVVCIKTKELRNLGIHFYSFNLKKKLEKFYILSQLCMLLKYGLFGK